MLVPMKIYGTAIEGGQPLTADNEVTTTQPGIVFDNVLIEGDRWGSSGYYPATVLEKDGPRAFPAGTQIFEDHAEVGQDKVSKLLGVLAEAARYEVQEDGKKVLRAPMRFYSDKADWVKERMGALGISIRSGVTFAPGTREGRTGKIVTSFTEGISVDVVTRAGAGGKFGTIKESARPAGMEEADTEGKSMTPEEIAAISAGIAGAVAEALKPSLDAQTTALGELKTSVAESAPKGLTASQVSEKLTTAKLSKGAQERVWTEFEAKGDVEAKIAEESAMWAEAVAEAKKAGGNANFDESGKDKDGEQTVTESGVSGWAVNS